MLTSTTLLTSTLLLLASTDAANIDRFKAADRHNARLNAREYAALISSSGSSATPTSSPSSSVRWPAWNSSLAGTGYYTGGTAYPTGGTAYPTGTGVRGTGARPLSGQASKTTGMLDGAPWLSPTSFCDFGSVTYPTVAHPASITDTAQLCVYTALNSSATIHPKTTSAIPTDIPGIGGLGGCAAVDFGPDHQECPFGTDGWCNCNGVIVPPLPPTKTGLINCAITKQPTASNCPVNTAYSASLASAASVSSANAKATPNTKVSSFACPTNAVVGTPDGLGVGHSNQETVGDAKGRQQLLWSNFLSWGCDMPNNDHNDAAAEKICGSIPPNTVLSLGLGKQPFYMNSTSQTPDDPNCQKQFYNMAFTVKDKCEVPLTKDYCMGMYNNIKNSCPLIAPPKKGKAFVTWEGGLATDNCGVAYFTSGYDIIQSTTSNHNPFYDYTGAYWWDTNHILCGPSGASDPTYCPVAKKT